MLTSRRGGTVVSISHILQSGLAEASGSGAKQVELHHLREGEADELADETLTFLRSRPGRPSSVSGWTAVSPSNAGVIAWWAREAGLTTQAQRRTLHTLRRQTFDLLDERGLIVKPVRPSAVVDVSPGPETAAEAAEAEPAEAEAAAASEGLGAWILRLDPGVWDLGRFIADGHREVSAWAVEDNDRSAAMTRGQRVFLWAGGDGTVVMAGVWGAGWVVGPCQVRSVARRLLGRSCRQQPTQALRRCLDPVPATSGGPATGRRRSAAGSHRGPPGSVRQQSQQSHPGGSGRHARVGRGRSPWAASV